MANSLIDGAGDFNGQVLVNRLWAGRWWMVGSVILFTAAFIVAAYLMTPMYRASTVLIDASDQGSMGSLSSALGQLGGLASMAGVSLGSTGSALEESLAVLRSREFTEAFIRDLELMPVLLHKRWDADAGQWQGSPDTWPSLAQASKAFHEDVRAIHRDTRTGLITVQIVWRDPETAALWANELVARLNAEMRSRSILASTASFEYLQKELVQTSVVETRQAIARLMENQINKRMLANVTEEYALRVVDQALPPDSRDVIWPRKATMAMLGAMSGLLFGMLIALWVASKRPEE